MLEVVELPARSVDDAPGAPVVVEAAAARGDTIGGAKDVIGAMTVVGASTDLSVTA